MHAVTDDQGLPRQRLSADDRRSAIVAAARKLFARNGFHGTGTSDIAAAAGCSEPVIYKHFASKQALFAAALEDADAIGVTHRREAMRDQNRSAVPSSREDTLENLGLAAHVELGGRLVEQHQPRAQAHRAQRPREGHALPLTARQIGAAGVAAGQDRVEARELSGAGFLKRGEDRVVDAVFGFFGRSGR